MPRFQNVPERAGSEHQLLALGRREHFELRAGLGHPGAAILHDLIDGVVVVGIEQGIRPQMDVTLVIHRKDGTRKEVAVLLRIDTPIEVDYYLHGGILPFVLRDLVSKAGATAAATA